MKKLTPEQVDRLKPEVRARYEARLKKVQRNRRILAGVIVFAFAAVVFAVLSVTVLFRITTIDVVKSGKIYGKQDIISASGLNTGENMILTKFDVAENRIETMLPYILDAKISKNFSGRVTISVTDDTASVIFKVENGYALADSEGKVLEVLKQEPKDSSFRVLKTKKSLKAVPGQTIGFADNAEQNLYNTLCTALKNAEIYDNVTEIDISDVTSIKVIYQNRMRIKIGTISDIDSKLEAAVKTIAMEDENNPNTIAEINVTIAKKVYVNPLDSLVEKKEEKDTKDKPDETTVKADVETTAENQDDNSEQESKKESSEGDSEEKTTEQTTENTTEKSENEEAENSEE